MYIPTNHQRPRPPPILLPSDHHPPPLVFATPTLVRAGGPVYLLPPRNPLRDHISDQEKLILLPCELHCHHRHCDRIIPSLTPIPPVLPRIPPGSMDLPLPLPSAGSASVRLRPHFSGPRYPRDLDHFIDFDRVLDGIRVTVDLFDRFWIWDNITAAAAGDINLLKKKVDMVLNLDYVQGMSSDLEVSTCALQQTTTSVVSSVGEKGYDNSVVTFNNQMKLEYVNNSMKMYDNHGLDQLLLMFKYKKKEPQNSHKGDLLLGSKEEKSGSIVRFHLAPQFAWEMAGAM
ncbi:hypothetical protein E3N88_23609 [Mikania micrantha]|uniref:Uncharacterized protein n=1 Tax=Mikania micrantha TaxID=192012 RepID=A0A5N6NGE7_9ASTR|nr:hypothetical protein E3N88_23609 [Mikania micrantha]